MIGDGVADGDAELRRGQDVPDGEGVGMGCGIFSSHCNGISASRRQFNSAGVASASWSAHLVVEENARIRSDAAPGEWCQAITAGFIEVYELTDTSLEGVDIGVAGKFNEARARSRDVVRNGLPRLNGKGIGRRNVPDLELIGISRTAFGVQ